MKEIQLSKKGKKYKDKFALVDDSLFEEVNKYNWTYQHGYARNNKMNILLHRFVFELKYGKIPLGLEVDHIDENKLNCQISNLRLATHAENMRNKTMQKNNKSGFKGICKKVCRRMRKNGTIRIKEYWLAHIKKNGKRYTKRFPYTNEGLKLAQEWRIEKASELHKNFSIYNKLKK